MTTIPFMFQIPEFQTTMRQPLLTLVIESRMLLFAIPRTQFYRRLACFSAIVLCGFAFVLPAIAQQRIRFPSGSQFYPGTYPATSPTAATPWTPIAPPTAPALPPTFSTPPASATPWTPVPGGATLGGRIQPFDPYATPQTGFPSLPPPAFPAQAYPAQTFPGQPLLPPAANTAPALPPYQPMTPGLQPPPLNGSVPPGSLGPIYGPTIEREPVFPNGINWNSRSGQPQRLFQDTGGLYTYLHGDNDNQLQIHEIEVFTSAVIMNLFNTPYGLRITPGFAFHFLDGPAVPGAIQMPDAIYSAYVNGLWQPQLTPQFGADLNVRVGVYTDFNSVTTDSLRITGRALGVVPLTPTMTLKAGVEYLDRLSVKMLPAGGILYEPDPQTRWDIYFPRPKFSKYLTTRGNTEFWWHIGAEYGGGNWTIERLNAPGLGMSERVDINDIRVFVGIDWNQFDRFDGIAEIGYVFDREIVVSGQPTESIQLDDTVMARIGIKF